MKRAKTDAKADASAAVAVLVPVLSEVLTCLALRDRLRLGRVCTRFRSGRGRVRDVKLDYLSLLHCVDAGLAHGLCLVPSAVENVILDCRQWVPSTWLKLMGAMTGLKQLIVSSSLAPPETLRLLRQLELRQHGKLVLMTADLEVRQIRPACFDRLRELELVVTSARMLLNLKIRLPALEDLKLWGATQEADVAHWECLSSTYMPALRKFGLFGRSVAGFMLTYVPPETRDRLTDISLGSVFLAHLVPLQLSPFSGLRSLGLGVPVGSWHQRFAVTRAVTEILKLGCLEELRTFGVPFPCRVVQAPSLKTCQAKFDARQEFQAWTPGKFFDAPCLGELTLEFADEALFGGLTGCLARVPSLRMLEVAGTKTLFVEDLPTSLERLHARKLGELRATRLAIASSCPYAALKRKCKLQELSLELAHSVARSQAAAHIALPDTLVSIT